MKTFFSFLLLLVFHSLSFSQSVSVNTDGSSPDPSAILDVKSTVKGFLLPRMTTAQRIAIASPANGLQVFDTDTKTFWFYNGNAWTESATGSPTNYWTPNGANIYFNSGNVGIGESNPATKLFVKTGTGNFGLTHTDGSIWVSTYIGSDAASDAAGGWIGTQTNHPLYLFANGGLPKISVLQNGNVGVGTALPDVRLSIYSNVVAGNDNTYLLSLHGRNPVLNFTDENNVAIGYVKSWTHSPYAPFTNGFLIGSAPGYPIFFSTNNYGLSMIITDNGNVGIGTANPTYKLSVNGNVRSKEVVVESNWADFVFDKKYQLPKLDEIEQFVIQNKHLPGIPSASEIENKGLSIGEMQSKMMQKIEELTLYIIALQKQVDHLKEERDENR